MTPEELKKAIEYNFEEADKDRFTRTHVVQLVEHWQRSHDIEADGWCGPKTQASLDSAIVRPRAESMLAWKPWDGPLSIQPTKRSEVYSMFGNPGSGTMSQGWYRDSIVECHPNLGNQLPGVPGKWWVKVHRLIEPYLREALRRAQAAAPEYKITRIGGQNFRHIRHDSKNPLSMHSWGIAVDINPRENFSKTFKAGKGPVAWSDEYNAIWPDGLPEAFVDAFKSCGFAWGSDWDEDGMSEDHTYYDPMHFEWVARDGKANGV